MINIKNLIQKIAQNRWVQHLLFWVVSYYILLRFFAYENEIYRSDLLYTGLFHLSIIVVVYLNLKILISLFLQKNRLLLYLFMVILLLFLGVKLNEFTFNYLSDWLFPKYFFISYYEFQTLVYFFLIYWGVTTLLKFSKAWFTLNEARQKLQKLQTATFEAELKELKSQINPHFLFNALNSIYGLAIDAQKETPLAVLKLSEVLRYVLYESNELMVPLRKEIKYLHDYIEIQRLRLEDNVDLIFERKGEISGKKIAPLLLIPFVENGFKHGLKAATENMYFHICIEIYENRIVFITKNNQGEIDETHQLKGIGLENVKRRLALIYPNRHVLEIKDVHDFFEIKLEIIL